MDFQGEEKMNFNRTLRVVFASAAIVLGGCAMNMEREADFDSLPGTIEDLQNRFPLLPDPEFNVFYGDDKVDCPEFQSFMNDDFAPLSEKYGAAAALGTGERLVQGCIDRYLRDNPEKAQPVFPWLDKNRKYMI